MDTYVIDMQDCGPMVLDALIKIKDEIDPDTHLSPFLPEGICGSCSMNIGGTNTLACTRMVEDVRGTVKIYPAAAHAGGQGSRHGPDQFLRPVRLHQAVAGDAYTAASGPRAAAVQGGPGKDQRAVGLYSVRMLLHGVPELLVESGALPGARQRCCRPTAGSWTAATR